MSIGSAIRASIESGNRTEWDVKREWGNIVPFDIGVDKFDDFVCLVEKNAKTPIRRMKVFAVAAVDQGGVTVPIYEKVDDSHFEIVTTFTFMLHRMTESQRERLGGIERKVELWLELGTDGSVKAEVFDEWDPEHRRKFNRPGAEDSTSQEGASNVERVLGLLVFLLFALYVSVRVAFNVVHVIHEDL